METFLALQTRMEQVAALATALNGGMQTIAGLLVTLQRQLAEETSMISTLREHMALGAVITQEDIEVLAGQVATIHSTLTEALGHEQAILGLFAPESPVVPPSDSMPEG